MGLLSTLKMYTQRTSKLEQPSDIYDHQVKLLDGGELDLASLRGHPTLIVNSALAPRRPFTCPAWAEARCGR